MEQPTLREIFQWEVRTWSRALPLWESSLPARRPLRALGVGEREGGLSLWLASRGVDVVCSDLHEFPEETKALHSRYGLEASITYAQADATRLPYDGQTFDLVFFKSMLGALGTKEQQRTALAEMHRVLKPGGLLFFAENLRGTLIHRWLRKRFVRWSSYWRYLDTIHDRDLFKDFTTVELRTTGLFANLGRQEWQRDLLARLDALLVRLVPERWHAVIHGSATKT